MLADMMKLTRGLLTLCLLSSYSHALSITPDGELSGDSQFGVIAGDWLPIENGPSYKLSWNTEVEEIPFDIANSTYPVPISKSSREKAGEHIFFQWVIPPQLTEPPLQQLSILITLFTPINPQENPPQILSTHTFPIEQPHNKSPDALELNYRFMCSNSDCLHIYFPVSDNVQNLKFINPNNGVRHIIAIKIKNDTPAINNLTADVCVVQKQSNTTDQTTPLAPTTYPCWETGTNPSVPSHPPIHSNTSHLTPYNFWNPFLPQHRIPTGYAEGMTQPPFPGQAFQPMHLPPFHNPTGFQPIRDSKVNAFTPLPTPPSALFNFPRTSSPSTQPLLSQSGKATVQPKPEDGLSNVSTKKKRSVYSKGQISELETVFLKQQNLDKNARIYLGSRINLSEKQVKVWFQNRRAKWRKQQSKKATNADAQLEAKFSPDSSNERFFW